MRSTCNISKQLASKPETKTKPDSQKLSIRIVNIYKISNVRSFAAFGTSQKTRDGRNNEVSHRLLETFLLHKDELFQLLYR